MQRPIFSVVVLVCAATTKCYSLGGFSNRLLPPHCYRAETQDQGTSRLCCCFRPHVLAWWQLRLPFHGRVCVCVSERMGGRERERKRKRITSGVTSQDAVFSLFETGSLTSQELTIWAGCPLIPKDLPASTSLSSGYKHELSQLVFSVGCGDWT